MVTLIFIIWFLGINSVLNDSQKCEYTLSDGTKLDLTPLRKLNGDYELIESRYTYKANFCGPLNSKCLGDPGVPAGFFLSNSNICISRYSYNFAPTTSYINENSHQNGVKLIFPLGEKCSFGNGFYKLNYLLNCDMNTEIRFDSASKKSSCEIDYIFTTKHGCINENGHFSYFGFHSEKSLISPKHTLIFLVSCFSIYFALNTYLNFNRNPEDGLIKALPHRIFWSNFFENVSKGVQVSNSFVRKLFGISN